MCSGEIVGCYCVLRCVHGRKESLHTHSSVLGLRSSERMEDTKEPGAAEATPACERRCRSSMCRGGRRVLSDDVKLTPRTPTAR